MTTTTTMAAKPAERAGKGAQQLVPTIVGASSATVLARLDPQDREMFLDVISNKAEYIDHPLLRSRKAERELFDDDNDASQRFEPFALSDLSEMETIQAGTTVLTAAQERELFVKFNFARYREFRILKAHHNKRMALAEIRELLKWHRRAQHVRVQITQANVPLVLAMAKRTRLSTIDFSDLVSEGNLALLRSVDKFDASRGFKFSTYACRAILKAFSRVRMKASQYRSRFPTEFDPALERSDQAERKRDELQADCALELRTILDRNLAGLTDVEQTVISARFALEQPKDTDGLPIMTLEQVGDLIGVTKERVRQIQKKAMAKLKNALEGGILAV